MDVGTLDIAVSPLLRKQLVPPLPARGCSVDARFPKTPREYTAHNEYGPVQRPIEPFSPVLHSVDLTAIQVRHRRTRCHLFLEEFPPLVRGGPRQRDRCLSLISEPLQVSDSPPILVEALSLSYLGLSFHYL